MEAEADDVRAVRFHGVQRVGQRLRGEHTTAHAATPRRGEDDPARGQQAGIEIVARPVGKLDQLPGCQVEAEDVPDLGAGGRGKQEFGAVVAQFQAGELARQFLARPRPGGGLDARQRRLGAGLMFEVAEDERPAPPAVPGPDGPRLLDDALVARLFEHADNVVEVEQGIGEDELPAQRTGLEEQVPPG